MEGETGVLVGAVGVDALGCIPELLEHLQLRRGEMAPLAEDLADFDVELVGLGDDVTADGAELVVEGLKRGHADDHARRQVDKRREVFDGGLRQTFLRVSDYGW